MAEKERFSNPNCGDTINLRLFTYNSNARRDVVSISKVEIFFLDPMEKTPENPNGARLIETIEGTEVTKESTGQYLLQLNLTDPLYTIGSYQDVWTVNFEENECAEGTITNVFEVHSDLWFTTAIPPIYDFNFRFRPNRLRKGTKRYILIEITPNVPRGSDIQSYYENLAVVSNLRVSIEMQCGDCIPAEKDLRLIVDRELVDYREKCFGYFFINTEEYDAGIYNIWFETEFGENIFISEKNSFQITD
jgi:hypothetical protein